MTEYQIAQCKECEKDFEKSTYQSVWYLPSVIDNLILVSMIPDLDLRRKIRVPSKLFCSKECKVTFFGKQAKAKKSPPPIIIRDKKRALLTDKQIRESKIYGLREIQLLLRGTDLEP